MRRPHDMGGPTDDQAPRDWPVVVAIQCLLPVALNPDMPRRHAYVADGIRGLGGDQVALQSNDPLDRRLLRCGRVPVPPF